MIARRMLLLASGALALTACATPSDLGGERTEYQRTPPSGADAEINFYDYSALKHPDQSLAITFDDGSGPRTVGADLRLREFEFPSTPRYATRNTGTLKVTVTLNRAGRAAATTVFDLALKSDWIWGVAIHTEVENPMQSCIGCMGASRAAIAPDLARAPGETLWINWSGNSILSPAVY